MLSSINIKLLRKEITFHTISSRPPALGPLAQGSPYYQTRYLLPRGGQAGRAWFICN